MFTKLLHSRKAFTFALGLSLALGPCFAMAQVRCEQIFYSSSSEIFQKVESFRDYQKLTSQLYEDFEINDIAKALISRIHKQENEFKLKIPEVKVDLKNNSDIILFFSSVHIKSILDKGFLNQHQTQSSSAYFTPGLRRRVENTLVGVDLGTHPGAAQLRPKFAFLNIREPIELTPKTDLIERQYGAIGAVMKNQIKERSTWSTSDTNMIVMGNTGYEVSPSEMRKHHGTFDRPFFPTTAIDRSYYEAQIFGTLTFADVEYFLVDNEISFEALKVAGKPIYAMRFERLHHRIVYKKGDLLFDGASVH